MLTAHFDVQIENPKKPDYFLAQNIRDRSVVPDVKPGYLRPLVPAEAPEVSSLTHCIATDLGAVYILRAHERDNFRPPPPKSR